MQAKEFAALCEKLGLKGVDKIYFGVIGRWPVMVTWHDYIQLHVTVDDAKNKEARAALRSALKGWANLGVQGDDVIITLRCKRFNGTAYDCVLAALSAAESAGYEPMPVCPYCGRTGCDVAAHYKNQYRLAHYGCLNDAANEAGDTAEQTKEKGSYILGIIGAILGMLVGTIPSLLTIVFLGMEYAVLFALIPICAYYGYKFLGGKMNRVAIVVTIIMAVIGVYMLTFEYVTYLDIVENGYAASDAFWLFIAYAGYLPNYVSLIGDLIVEFLFAAIGVYISWRIISRTPMSTALEMKAVLELAVPYSGQNAQYSAENVKEEETV